GLQRAQEDRVAAEDLEIDSAIEEPLLAERPCVVDVVPRVSGDPEGPRLRAAELGRGRVVVDLAPRPRAADLVPDRRARRETAHVDLVNAGGLTIERAPHHERV